MTGHAAKKNIMINQLLYVLMFNKHDRIYFQDEREGRTKFKNCKKVNNLGRSDNLAQDEAIFSSADGASRWRGLGPCSPLNILNSRSSEMLF